MIRIEINNNNTYELKGKLKVIKKIQEAFKIKHPNAFHLRRSGSIPRGWDGMMNFIGEESFKFKAGLFQQVYEAAAAKDKVEIIDNRIEWNVKPRLPKKIGNLIPRGYQLDAIRSVIEHKVGKVPHYIGTVDAATNAGKTMLMAGIYLAFKKKIPAIILLKDVTLFEQFKKELPELLPGVNIKFIRGKQIEFGDVTVTMVQTLSPKARMFREKLAKFGICLVDEADQGNSKSYRNIMENLLGAKVKIGLSGTIYMSKLVKDKVNNQKLHEFFGEVLFKITKKEMVDLGFSTDVIIRLWKGSTLPGFKGYPEEYRNNLTMNSDRNNKIVDRVKRAIRFNRTPSLVVFKFHEHGEVLEKMFRKKIKGQTIAMCHGGTKDRMQIIKDFRDGKIDILIASLIMLRGKNAPLIRHIVNAAGGDSQEQVSQLMGRGERKHESKKRYHMDDFMDEGRYLKRHSKHRRNYYLAEGFKLIEMKK